MLHNFTEWKDGKIIHPYSPIYLSLVKVHVDDVIKLANVTVQYNTIYNARTHSTLLTMPLSDKVKGYAHNFQCNL